MTGDARDPAVLRNANVATSRMLIALAGSDSTNAEIVVRASELSSGVDRDTPLRCLAHIKDADLCAALRADEVSHPSEWNAQLDFFNVFEQGAK